MKILLVSPFFAPNNTIGALRPTKMASFLAEHGHIIDVITAGGISDSSFNIPQNIRCIYTMEPYAEEITRKKQYRESFIYKVAHASNGNLMSSFRNYRYEFEELRQEKRFVNYFLSLVSNELASIHYDVIITTYSPLSSLICGLKYKKTHPSIIWISDYRDAVVLPTTSLLFRFKRKKLQSRSCAIADMIVAVSRGTMDQICGGKYTEKQLVLPNGFDNKDLNEILSIKKEETRYVTRQLKFAYVGSLYAGRRDLAVFFKALSELCNSGEIEKRNIKFLYAGTDYTALCTQARQYDCEEILQNVGKLSRQDCLKLQNEAECLLLATWNTRKEQGIFTGKFLEYMMMEKPIIATIVGDVPNSEVARVLREGNLGVAYEESCDATDYLILKNYIASLYGEYMKSGTICFVPNKAVTERYKWENLICQLELRLLAMEDK